ncbi:Fur-regulated basic protein FbpA [Metabacillus arenae]|nr:Fur-regulated basic protein FbpA [Metabacillus arenae]
MKETLINKLLNKGIFKSDDGRQLYELNVEELTKILFVDHKERF